MFQPLQSPADVAARFGCTEEQAAAQFRKNGARALEMRNECIRRGAGKKYRGYTLAQLEESLARYVAARYVEVAS